MTFDFSDAQIVAALIAATGTVSAAIVAAVIGWRFNSGRQDRRRLRERLCTACQDIDFLLEVERRLLEECRHAGVDIGKTRIRAAAQTSGKRWSGLNTPGVVRRDRAQCGSSADV